MQTTEQRSPWLPVEQAARVLLWIVYLWLIVNLVLLFLAFMLQLLGANPEAEFVDWVYRSVTRTMAPFRGMFEPLTLSDKSVLDTSLLFAMVIYGLVALLIRSGIDWVTARISQQQRQAGPPPQRPPVQGQQPPPTGTAPPPGRAYG
jgi:hypothetical protein